MVSFTLICAEWTNPSLIRRYLGRPAAHELEATCPVERWSRVAARHHRVGCYVAVRSTYVDAGAWVSTCAAIFANIIQPGITIASTSCEHTSPCLTKTSIDCTCGHFNVSNWLGESGSMQSRSSDIMMIGLLFTMPSTYVTSVYQSASVRYKGPLKSCGQNGCCSKLSEDWSTIVCPYVSVRCRFVFHSMTSWRRLVLFLPFSHVIVSTGPRRLMKRSKACRNELVVSMVCRTFMWMARIYTHIACARFALSLLQIGWKHLLLHYQCTYR